MRVKCKFIYRGRKGGRGNGAWTIRLIVNGVATDHEGYRSKAATVRLAGPLIEHAEMLDAGLIDPFALAKHTPMEECIAAFLEAVRIGAGSAGRRLKRPPTDDYVQRFGVELRRVASQVGWSTVGDLDGQKLLAWLVQQKDWAPGTVGRLAIMLRQFGAWLAETGHCKEQPFSKLRQIPAKGPAKHVRGYLAPDEFQRLREAPVARALRTKGEIRRQELLGKARERVHCYCFVAYTGLRRREFMLLQWGNLDFCGSPGVNLPAPLAKSRKAARIELRGDVAEDMQRHRQELEQHLGRSVQPSDRLFPRTSFVHLNTQLKLDLAEAKVGQLRDGRVYNGRGQVLNLHSLRTTYCSWLGHSGAAPRTIMQAMRHEDIRLSMETYMRQPDTAMRNAVDALPPLDPPPSPQKPVEGIRWRQAGSAGLKRLSDSKEA